MIRAVERSVERPLPRWRAYHPFHEVFLRHLSERVGPVPTLILALADEDAERIWWPPAALSDGSEGVPRV